MPEQDPMSWTQPGHYGAADTGVAFAEATIATAWNVHGRATHLPFAYQVQAQFGVTLPGAANAIARNDHATVLWLGPTSWLILAGATPLSDFTVRREALNAAGGALFDVTDARIAWTIAGSRAATVLAKGCPIDLHSGAFPSGTCAQSLYGHVNSLLVKDTDERFTLLVARSFARDVWDMLCRSAAQYGYEVKPPAPYR